MDGSRKNFRPTLCLLEDRTVPTTFRPVISGPATHLQVIVPTQVQAGASFNVEVDARAANGAVAPSFTGNVLISLATADGGASIPLKYNYTAKDGGVHVFHVTLTKAGAQKIVATSAKFIAGAAMTVKPGAATHLVVAAPTLAAVGVNTKITVSAADAYNNVATAFTGNVNLSTTNANLPTSYTFVAADHGQHTFTIKYTLTGSKTIAASNSGIAAGQTSLQVYVPGVATHFLVQAAGPVVAGTPTFVQVTALDAAGNVAQGYLGVIHFATNDSLASLIGDYGFTSSDMGSHLFRIPFGTVGIQTLTVMDASFPGVLGATTINVIPPVGPINPWTWSNWGYA